MMASMNTQATGSKEQNFTINKANAVITASNITKTIGEKDFGFGAKVDSNGTLSYTSKNTKVIKVVKGKAQIVKDGTANITIKAAATANYNEATKTITIKVNKLKKATLSKVASKKYYVKVCSYVKVGKKVVLGSYSKVKSVKVKK